MTFINELHIVLIFGIDVYSEMEGDVVCFHPRKRRNIIHASMRHLHYKNDVNNLHLDPCIKYEKVSKVLSWLFSHISLPLMLLLLKIKRFESNFHIQAQFRRLFPARCSVIPLCHFAPFFFFRLRSLQLMKVGSHLRILFSVVTPFRGSQFFLRLRIYCIFPFWTDDVNKILTETFFYSCFVQKKLNYWIIFIQFTIYRV